MSSSRTATMTAPGRTGTTTSGTAKRTAPKGRADAARNRERIIAAAREAFVVHGADAPLDEIARQAGVGNATLYRHFHDRDALAHGVVLAVTDRIAERAQAALDDDVEPFEALRRFVRGAIEEQIGALCPLLSERFDSDAELLAARMRLEGLGETLVEQAQRAGQLRPDVAVGDLMVAISQLTRPLPGTGCGMIQRFVDRHVQLFLDGLQAPARSQLPGHAATLEELRQGA